MERTTRHLSRQRKDVSVLNPVTTEFEFTGPYLGPLGIIIGLPLLVSASAFYYSQTSDWSSWPSQLPSLKDVQTSFSWEALVVYTTWWLFQALLYLLVPATIVPGTLLRDGSRLFYRINGMAVHFSHPRCTLYGKRLT
jgi:hypothetical protein